MVNLHDPAPTDPSGLGDLAGPPMPPGAIRCWQVMTGLAIDNRADAIDYLCLHHADPALRLSPAVLSALLAAFPLLPATSLTRRSTHDNAR